MTTLKTCKICGETFYTRVVAYKHLYKKHFKTFINEEML